MEQFDEKSFDATPHRREKAAEEGHVPRSADLTSSILLLTSLCLLLWLGNTLATFCAEQLREHLGGDATLHLDAETATNRISNLAQELAWRLAPILGGMMLVAVLVNLAQVGFLFLPEKVAPDFGHLDPLAGAERVFSFSSVVRLGFGMLKVVLVVSVAVASLWSEWPRIIGMASMDVGQIATYTWEVVLWTSIKIAAALVVLALLDYIYQVWRNDEDLKMSAQEMKEEMKMLQGDPHVIQRRKSIMRQMALQNIGKAVSEADAIITNPTELAIALKYDPEKMAAPIVLAKGAGVVAQRIRRLALESGIPIVERKELAQVLYREVDVNQPVPVAQYAAVAEVLKYVYELKGIVPKGLQKAAQAA